MKSLTCKNSLNNFALSQSRFADSRDIRRKCRQYSKLCHVVFVKDGTGGYCWIMNLAQIKRSRERNSPKPQYRSVVIPLSANRTLNLFCLAVFAS